MRREFDDGAASSGRIRTRVFEGVTDSIPGWDTLSRPERWATLAPVGEFDAATVAGQTPLTEGRARALLSRPPPTASTDTTSNTTTDLLAETEVQLFNPNETAPTPLFDALLVGDDGASGVSQTDTTLNNKLGGVQLTLVAGTGVGDSRDLEFSAFIDSSEFNGFTLDEVGVVNNLTDERLYNHATITDVDKTSQKQVTIDGTISFRPA
jgi:hypothetical protein